MPKTNFNYLSKNYEEFLNNNSNPTDKIKFLDDTLFKRKSLIDKKSKKIIKNKKNKKNNDKPKALKCPIYKCFKEMSCDEELVSHYNE